MRIRTISVIIIAVIVVLVALPYYAWSNYEADVAVYEEPTWEYPFERGYEMSIAWTATTIAKADYPYMTATCDLTVNSVYFDILDWDTEQAPESVSFWSYFADYYGMGIGSVVPEDSVFAVSMTCLFEKPDGSKEWIPIGEDGWVRWYGYDSAGTYSDDFVVFTRGQTGTYTFRLTVLVEGSPDTWNVTIAWDKAVIDVVNIYEQ